MRQLRADFVRNHLPGLAIFCYATLCGIGYVPVRDPLRRDHVTELWHIHLRYIIEFDVRKSGDVFRLMAAEVAADLAHGFHSLLVDFLTGLNAGTANLYAALGRHFQQRFGHWAAARVLDANEEDLQDISNFSDRPKRLVAEKSAPPDSYVIGTGKSHNAIEENLRCSSASSIRERGFNTR